MLHKIYRAEQRRWGIGGDDVLFAQKGYDRYDFALLRRPGEGYGMFTLWSKDGNTFEKRGYGELEVTLATLEETAGLLESYNSLKQ